jgi:hypothetical protein
VLASHGHWFKHRLHKLFESVEPLVVVPPAQAAVKRDLKVVQRAIWCNPCAASSRIPPIRYADLAGDLCDQVASCRVLFPMSQRPSSTDPTMMT